MSMDAMTTKSHSTKPSFLDLPAELRFQIYTFSLGGRVLHILAREQHRNDYRICAGDQESRISNTWEQWEEGHLTPLPCAGFEGCGVASRGQSKDPSTMSRKNEKLSLNLLLVNKQIYREGKLIPFKQNIFHFDDQMQWAYFSDAYNIRTPESRIQQLDAIHNVAITVRIGPAHRNNWIEEQHLRHIPQLLPNIRSFQVTLLASLYTPDFSETTPVQEYFEDLLQPHHMFPLDYFSRTSLSNVEIILHTFLVDGGYDAANDGPVKRKVVAIKDASRSDIIENLKSFVLEKGSDERLEEMRLKLQDGPMLRNRDDACAVQ